MASGVLKGSGEVCYTNSVKGFVVKGELDVGVATFFPFAVDEGRWLESAHEVGVFLGDVLWLFIWFAHGFIILVVKVRKNLDAEVRFLCFLFV